MAHPQEFDEVYRLMEKIKILLPLDNEEAIDKAFQEYFDEEKRLTGGLYDTPDKFKLLFDGLNLIADNHIRKGDMATLFFHMHEWREAFDNFCEHAPFSEEEKRPVKESFLRLHTKILDFAKAVSAGEEEIKEERNHQNQKNMRSPECRCMLCRKAKADETGSHMVPNCIIERLFSYDGQKGRERAVVERFTLSEGGHYTYIGRDVLEDAREGLINRPLRNEELEQADLKHNPLTFDHYFCKACEKRFSTIESWYSEILAGKKQYPPAVPYLFWMSVIWRMSISATGIALSSQHEEKYRAILDKALALKRDNVVTNPSKLGHCGYTIHRASELKGEQTGILGIPAPTIPALAIIGDTIVRFYHSLDKARKVTRLLQQPEDTINSGREPEVIAPCTFMNFWFAKRSILDAQWEIDYDMDFGDPSGVSQLLVLKNFEKEHLDETGEVASFNTDKLPDPQEAPYRLVIPRPLMRVIRYKESHPDAKIEDVAQALGYTIEEMQMIYSQWDKQTERYFNKVD